MAYRKILRPCMMKELRHSLVTKARARVMAQCTQTLHDWLNVRNVNTLARCEGMKSTS